MIPDFRTFLLEGHEDDVRDGSRQLLAALRKDYPGFVRSLKGMLGDGKVLAAIAAGHEDGKPYDERIEFPSSPVAVNVADLHPTQNEVNVDKSLAYQLGGRNVNQLSDILSGKPVTLKAPIIVFNGKYVIDGHHRWSQVYATNAQGRITALNLTAKGVEPMDVLKAMQLGIATVARNIPVETVEGKNLFKVSEGWLKEYVKTGRGTSSDYDGPTDDTMAVYAKHGVASLDALADRIWSNVSAMQKRSQPVRGAADRGTMPQTDTVAHLPAFKDFIQGGQANFKEPLSK